MTHHAPQLSHHRYLIYCRKSTEDDTKQVQSIEDQLQILEDYAQRNKLNIVGTFSESKTAKKPGREEFGKMMAEITAGRADAILIWKLDRLARNPVDDATIRWHLQQGVIKAITTPEKSYFPWDNVLQMDLEFSMATQYSRDLARNVMRGLRSKCERGWKPNTAPIGYLNDPGGAKGERQILPDPDRFDLVQRMWRMVIARGHTPAEVHRIASREWGLTTFPRRKTGGKPLSVAGFYEVLNNVFYTGKFAWDGKVYEGKHKPMITQAEFDEVQRILGDKAKYAPKHREWLYAGLMKCPECGCGVCADETRKKLADGTPKTYVHYRCTKKRGKCSQRTINQEVLERQISERLEKIQVSERLLDWAMEHLAELNKQEIRDREKIRDSVEKRHKDCVRQLDRLTDLLVREMLTDDEYSSKKTALLVEKEKLETDLADAHQRATEISDRTEGAFKFCKQVTLAFVTGDRVKRHSILRAMSSELFLEARNFRPVWKPWFQEIAEGVEEANAEIDRLELPETPTTQSQIASLEALKVRWWPRPDLNR